MIITGLAMCLGAVVGAISLRQCRPLRAITIATVLCLIALLLIEHRHHEDGDPMPTPRDGDRKLIDAQHLMRHGHYGEARIMFQDAAVSCGARGLALSKATECLLYDGPGPDELDVAERECVWLLANNLAKSDALVIWSNIHVFRGEFEAAEEKLRMAVGVDGNVVALASLNKMAKRKN